MRDESTVATAVPPLDTTTAVEFDWLMSLALDGLLDEEEYTRFHVLLQHYPPLATAWAAWQFIDTELASTPAVVPASNFVGRFETHLAHYEQRRQRRVVLLTASLALVAGASVFAGMAGLGMFVFLTQGHWIGEQMRMLALAYTSMNRWLDSTVATAAAMASSPQAQAVGFAYATAMVTMLAGCIYLLRRSVRLDGASTFMQTE